jgi:hypothetical protein
MTMQNIKLSAHYKHGKPAGFKKFVGGESFFLGTDRMKAERVAAALVTRWKLLKANGQTWTDEIIAECRAAAAKCGDPPESLTALASSPLAGLSPRLDLLSAAAGPPLVP